MIDSSIKKTKSYNLNKSSKNEEILGKYIAESNNDKRKLKGSDYNRW